MRGCGRGGIRAESDGCGLEPSRGARRCLPAPPGVSLCCAGCDAAVALGSRVEFWVEGAGTWSRAGWGCGLGGTETLQGVRARDRAAGPVPPLCRPPSPAASRRPPARPAAAPRGAVGEAPACPPPPPARSLAPAPPTRARPPGLRSRVGVGLRPRAAGIWHGGLAGSRSRVPGGLGSRSRRGGLGSLPSVSAPSPATPRSPPLK